MSTNPYDNLPDGTMIHTPRTGWIGEVIDGELYCIATASEVYSPSFRLGWNASQIPKMWGSIFGEIIIALPGTPEWDELNARAMTAILTQPVSNRE